MSKFTAPDWLRHEYEREVRLTREKRRAAAKNMRKHQRTPTRGKQRDADNAEIADYLARVPSGKVY